MHSIRQIREHDHIAQIRQVFLSPSDIFANELPPTVSYEPSEVGTLASYLTNQETELHGYDSLQICSNVAEGLSALHQHGVAHNDVQCGNILLFRSEGSEQRLSAKLAGFGSISFLSSARVSTPWAAAPELFAPQSSAYEGSIALGDSVDPVCLQAPKGTCHDLYSLGLLCWAVHLRLANPFLHYLFDDAVLTPSQATARHWAQVSFQDGDNFTDSHTEGGCIRLSAKLSGTDLRAVQSLKADPTDRLLGVVQQTFKDSKVTDSSSYLQKAVSRLCLHSPKSRSLGAAMAALQGKRKFFNSATEDKTKVEPSIWEKGWMLSLQPESRMASFNQHLAIKGSISI
ncbi:kinase-like domain-containing protein [Hypoxylon sp. NC1633]|nr:kinase-like domain-containing protein [Hypoxylon sp. NC1633]